jgi:hypothetical protein
MLTFKLEQPFQQKDIDTAIENTQKQAKSVNGKLQKVGLVVLAATIIGGYFWDIRFNKPEDFNKIMFLFLPFTFGVFNLLFPYIHKFFGGPSYVEHQPTFEYLSASMVTSHNCEAFIQMPGMEQYKEYVEKVKQQGRSLTNLECEKIIQHYESLI